MEDENEHVKTMTACRDYSIMADLVNKGKPKKERTSKVEPSEEEASINNMNTSQKH